MKILVTGSTGGIGRWVVRRLLEAGHSLRAMDIPGQPANSDYEYINGDIRDLAQVRRAAHGMDAIVHLAAIPGDWGQNAELVLDTNIHGTWNVLLAALETQVQRVVSFSSINALGQGEKSHSGLYLPLDDAIPHQPVQNYYLSKHIGEELCAAFAARGTFQAVSLRPTLVLSPEEGRMSWWDELPEEYKLEGHIKDFWSYVDVRDVADAVLLSLSAPVNVHQAFLLTADDNRTHTPTAQIIDKYYSHLTWPKVSKEEYLSRGEFISLVDCSAAKEVLGWQPKYCRFDPAAGYPHAQVVSSL